MTETTPSLIKTPDLDLRAAMRDPFAIVPRVLDLVRLNGAIFFRSHFRSPWAYTSPPVPEIAPNPGQSGPVPHRCRGQLLDRLG
jgi:hypothetical protein